MAGMRLPGSAGGWLAAFIVTTIVLAVVFRVPQLEKIVLGSNTARQG